MHACNKLYPNAWKMLNEFRADRGKGLPKWPAWCFLPMAGWYAIVCDGNKISMLGPDLVGDVSKLAAIGTWRYSQGIYRVDSDLLNALTDTTVKGELPSEVLYRLPEWCLYFETPGQQWLDDKLYGFWVHLEWDANTERSELRFLLDCDSDLIPVPLHMGNWTVTEAVDRAVSEAAKHAAILKSKLGEGLVEKMSEQINPLVSIVLYICSEEPEIDNDREPGTSPARPHPKKTKQGWKLFPPDKPKFWSVGNEIGKKLREASVGEENSGARRAHMRRGHWHGYWTGPLDSKRKFIYKWLHPMVVSGSKNEN